jgi:hypothetical protein
VVEVVDSEGKKQVRAMRTRKEDGQKRMEWRRRRGVREKGGGGEEGEVDIEEEDEEEDGGGRW